MAKGGKVIYDIVNPSDGYTIEALDLEIAAVACMLLGQGQYAFKPLDDSGDETEEQDVPLFLFGGVDEWCQEQFGKDVSALMDHVMESRVEELATCFDSCLIGGLAERREYESAMRLIESAENRERFRAERHDRRRSSLNDIGGRAYQMAKNLRGKKAEPIEPAPQQVLAG